jgi:hypothetical protein
MCSVPSGSAIHRAFSLKKKMIMTSCSIEPGIPKMEVNTVFLIENDIHASSSSNKKMKQN